MNHQYLAVGQEVVFVGPDKHKYKGKITIVYSDDEAQITWPNGSAIATYSDRGGEGTFHFEQASPKEEHKK